MSAIAEDRLHDNGTVVTAGGAWSGNSRIANAFLIGVRAAPNTATTIYDLSIVDRDGFVLFQKKAIKGPFVEHWLKIPVRAKVTVAIATVTAIEPFQLKLMWEGA